MRITLDTNVLVYAADARYPGKQRAAQGVYKALVQGRQPLALQVIGEFQNASRRRLARPAEVACKDAHDLFLQHPTFGYDAACVETALTQAAAGRLSYWDALLLAACDRAGVEILLSEDMQDGFVFLSVRVLNPFFGDGLSASVRELLQLQD